MKTPPAPKQKLLEDYYTKFKEEHRLTTRHGQVEFIVSMKMLHDAIPQEKKIKILDVGAGTGAYSIPLSKEGHDVTAVELVRHNLEILRSKHEKVKTWQGNALDLHFLDNELFDITIMFGPMYHLHTMQEKVCALNEARRVTKKGGQIFVSYIMNDYSIISYCICKNKIKECVDKKTLTKDFHIVDSPNDLYSYVRLEDINKINKLAGIKRVKIFAPDGAADYIRKELNALDKASFDLFVKYQLENCERPELLGASSHIVDVLEN